MKKLAVIALAILLTVPLAFAQISKNTVEEKLVKGLTTLRSASLSARENLTSVKNRMQGFVQNYAAQIDDGDETTLQGYGAVIQNAIDDLNVIINKIDTDFPSINE